MQDSEKITEISYDRGLKIKNLDSLKHGLGARILLCIYGENGDLVAKQWKRKKPKVTHGECLVIFK